MVPAPSYASARVKRGNRLVALAILVFFGADAAVVRIAGAGPLRPRIGLHGRAAGGACVSFSADKRFVAPYGILWMTVRGRFG
ncbi:hypothetical protein B5U84_05025 [Bifidobacterium bifidum]|nr:hypothetical protein APS66_06375 [Bifidobacterium bifidum]OSP26430.1 hypothetical protein BJL93_04895 [Bifidobacterium bifidum]ROV54307.1 hypothetical protein B5U84_05025 [Bifidobacterium bifidum]